MTEGKVTLPTPERIEEIRKRATEYVMSPSQHVIDLLDALEEAQGDIITLTQKVELYEEALGTYKDNRAYMKQQLTEAQQTIARLTSENDRLGSLVPVVKEASELLSWRDPGGGQGQVQALKLIYKWATENPSPDFVAGEGAES